MADAKVFLVAIANVGGVWGQCAPILEQALKRERTHDIHDVLGSILTQRSQLWIIWTDRVEAAAVTEFVNYPKGIWLRAWLAGARKDAEVDWPKWREVVSDWALANGCKELEVVGRMGWLRVFPDSHVDAVVMRAPLK